jgi:hypothetical protein
LSPKAKGAALEIGRRVDAGIRVGDHDREILGLAVVEDGRDDLGAGLVVGQHVAPRSHQGDVGFAVGQRLGEALPAIDGAQLDRPIELG